MNSVSPRPTSNGRSSIVAGVRVGSGVGVGVGVGEGVAVAVVVGGGLGSDVASGVPLDTGEGPGATIKLSSSLKVDINAAPPMTMRTAIATTARRTRPLAYAGGARRGAPGEELLSGRPNHSGRNHKWKGSRR